MKPDDWIAVSARLTTTDKFDSYVGRALIDRLRKLYNDGSNESLFLAKRTPNESTGKRMCIMLQKDWYRDNNREGIERSFAEAMSCLIESDRQASVLCPTLPLSWGLKQANCLTAVSVWMGGVDEDECMMRIDSYLETTRALTLAREGFETLYCKNCNILLAIACYVSREGHWCVACGEGLQDVMGPCVLSPRIEGVLQVLQGLYHRLPLQNVPDLALVSIGGLECRHSINISHVTCFVAESARVFQECAPPPGARRSH